MTAKHIYVIAGEPSGDFLGAQLMKSLKEQTPDIRFSGIGGPLMIEQGLESLFPMEELSVMGLAEILPQLMHLLKRIKQTAENIKETRPDVVVTIDAPDFSFRVAKKVRKDVKDPPKLIHYVAPTVWAWRPGRAKKISRFLDGLICLLDFEPPYFEKEGLRAEFAGHPVIESGALEADGPAYRDVAGIAPKEPVLGMFFGSRRSEVKRLGPILRDTALEISRNYTGNLHLVVPTLPHLEQAVFSHLKNYPGPVHITTKPENKWNAFASCDAAVAVSGTVGLELAAVGVPHVIAFNMSWPTWQIVKRVVKVRFAHLANIILDREVVPEYIQDRCFPDLIASGASLLLNDPHTASLQQKAFEEVRRHIGAGTNPSTRAAEFIIQM